MEFDEYQKLAARTAVFNKQDSDYILMYLSMGIAGESGEVVEKVKHIIRDAGGVVSEEKREGIKKEIGDVLWYLSQLAKELNLSFGDIADANIKKLASRQERNVLKSEGDNR
ncbi:MAG: nucleoside triphosphate pyrophosphohydrolase family protein [Candidatus Adlerbacteria bacterium]